MCIYINKLDLYINTKWIRTSAFHMGNNKACYSTDCYRDIVLDSQAYLFLFLSVVVLESKNRLSRYFLSVIFSPSLNQAFRE